MSTASTIPAPLELRASIGYFGDEALVDPVKLLGAPTLSVIDSRGLVYVADQLSFSIKVFDQDGTYRYSIGSAGEAPGEFRHITGMFVDDDDRLIVGDHINARITVFDSGGAYMRSIPLDYDDVMYPRWIGEHRGRGYLIASIQPEGRPNSQFLFHEFNPAFERTGSFGSAELFGDLSNTAVQVLSGLSVGSIQVVGDVIVYAPRLYRGEIYIFEWSGKRWTRTTTWTSTLDMPEAIETVYGEFERADVTATVNRAGQRIGVVMRAESLGLARLPNGNLIHFVNYLETDDEYGFVGEVFSPSGQPVHVLEFENSPAHGPNRVSRFHKFPQWVDTSGNVGMIEYGDTPVVRVYDFPDTQ